MRGRNLNLIAFVLICGAISYFDLKKCSRLPWPPRFIFAALTFLMMELITLMDETLGGVTAIGFVIAIFIKEGFVADCEHSVTATGQPQNVSLAGDVTAVDSSGGMSSVAEYQQAQAAPAGVPTQPGTTVV